MRDLHFHRVLWLFLLASMAGGCKFGPAVVAEPMEGARVLFARDVQEGYVIIPFTQPVWGDAEIAEGADAFGVWRDDVELLTDGPDAAWTCPVDIAGDDGKVYYELWKQRMGTLIRDLYQPVVPASEFDAWQRKVHARLQRSCHISSWKGVSYDGTNIIIYGIGKDGSADQPVWVRVRLRLANGQLHSRRVQVEYVAVSPYPNLVEQSVPGVIMN